ncbi:MAG TPA: pentapeptide repeat-containing protein [Streptosporangiaceae bacterium]
MLVPLGLVLPGIVVFAAPAQATTCPTVDSSTGAVTPAPVPGQQWPGCDLTGADLAGADISSGNLNGATLTSANLTGANLTGTDLMSADLTSADLTNAKLMQAMLSGTVLAGATLTGVSSGYISGSPASLPASWVIARNYLVGPGANLTYANLGGTDLSSQDVQGATLVHATLTSANLTGTNLQNADLTDAAASNVTLTGADLTGATLTGVSSGGITGSAASLPSPWVQAGGYLAGPGANLAGAALSGLGLSGLTLTGADLDSAVLTGTDLSNSDLTNAVLTGATLTSTQLAGAVLTGVQSGSVVGAPASLPANWQADGGYLFGPGADLHGASLIGFQLAGADLSGADLGASTLDSAKLGSANLANANLASALVESADLSNASLAGANLTGAALSDSSVGGAAFTGATLTGAAGAYLKGTPASMPARWYVLAGYLIGPGTGTNLTGINLSNLNLTGDNFTGLDLYQVTFRHSNLTGAKLVSTNLTGADFSYANLTRANLTGATVSSTVFAGTTWNSTICPDGTNSDSHAHGWCYPPPPSSGYTAHQLPTVPGGSAGSFVPQSVSCVSGTECYGAGYVSSVSNQWLAAVLQGNGGSTWSDAETALPAGAVTTSPAVAVTGMSCPATGHCFAGGTYRNSAGGQGMLLRHASSRWGVAKAPLPANAGPNSGGAVAGVTCRSVTFCFAVGQYAAAGLQYGAIWRWSGSAWAVKAAPMPAGADAVTLSTVTCPSATLCFAAGSRFGSAGSQHPLVLRWSSGSWSVVGVPLPASAAASPQAGITSMSCPSTTWCVAVGSYLDTSGHEQGLLLTRSGSTWAAVRAPLPATAGSNPWMSLGGVSCVTASQCTAAGGFENTALQPEGLLLFWSGKAWKAVQAPAGTVVLHAISCPSTTRCVAVGEGTGHALVLTGP